MSDSPGSEHRRFERETTYAKLILDGLPGYIRNISPEGIGVEFLMPVNLKAGDSADIEVHPEAETGLDVIRCRAQVRWLRPEPPYFHIGLVSLPGDEQARKALRLLLEQYRR
jgi:hypothetical protein